MFYDSLNEKIALIFILQLFYFDWADQTFLIYKKR